MRTRPLYAVAALALCTNASDPLSYHGGSILAMAGRDAAVLVLDKRIGAGNNLIGDECCRVLEASKRSLLAVRGIQGDVQSLLEDVAARLQQALVKALAAPKARELFAAQGFVVKNGNGEETVRLIRDELGRSQALIKSASIVVE